MDSATDDETVLQSCIRQQEVLTELGRRALETDDVGTLLREAAEAVVTALDTDYCHVLEDPPESDRLRLRARVGGHDGSLGHTMVPTDRTSQAGYPFDVSEPVVIENLGADERFGADALPIEPDVESGIVVPIGTDNPPWGVLGAFSSEAQAISDHDAAFLENVANVLAGAIDRIEAHRQLHERDVQLDLACQAGSIGLWTWDIQNDVVTADDYLASAYGMGPDVAESGAPMDDFYDSIHEEDTERTWEALERAVEETGELEAEYRVIGADGECIWVLARSEVEYDEDGEPVEMHGAIADITERKRRERALEEREERYRDLFTSMSEAYCVIEKLDTSPDEPIDFRYVEANPAFEEHTGIESVVGKTLREALQQTPEKWVDTYDHVARTGEPIQFERELVGQERMLECYAFPVGDESVEQVGVLFADISERVERERRLEQLIERLEASNERLEQFAYAASHDLQEPIRMVMSYLQLLEDRYADELDDDAEEFIAHAVDGANRMREMIKGLLEYSRVDTKGQQFESIDPNAIITDVMADLDLQIEEHDAEITVEDLPHVKGDDGQLRQLFQNLLDNAIEYSGEASPRIYVTGERRGSTCQFSVRDEGIGIDPNYHEQIFEVFQRLHSLEDHTGTGIGLALCQRIIERHDGEIWLESESGEGATFSFTLPAATDERADG